MEIRLWHELLLPYELAVKEMVIKFKHLKKEHREKELYSPIEQVSGRVKSINSILEKMQRKNISWEELEEKVEDIAGIRIICQFSEDIEKVADIIQERQDMRVLEIKDYITHMKESGYRSYHMIIAYHVETLEGPREIKAEIQIRTLAMNFWATIEHSLQYKYKGNMPPHVRTRLNNAAQSVLTLDEEMSSVRNEVMDAQNSMVHQSNIVKEILNNIENLYHYSNNREVAKIQDEFYRIYESKDLARLERFHQELDVIAEGTVRRRLRQRKSCNSKGKLMRLPEKYENEMKDLLQEEYEAYKESLGLPIQQGYRINTGKISKEEWKKIAPFSAKEVPWIEKGYFLLDDFRASRHPYYFAGLYYLQEPSAMTSANRLNVEPGDFVLDLCAAPGGKATELGSRLKGKGMLVANDISNSRAKALLKNLELAGIANLYVTSEEPAKLCQNFPEFFDKVLIDAPCSGEGMFHREPKMIEYWEKRGPEEYVPIQKQLILYGSRMLKPGGKLLYSTCTFSKKEDEEVIQWLLEQNTDMHLISIAPYEGIFKRIWIIRMCAYFSA